MKKRRSPFPFVALPLTGVWVWGVESYRTMRCYQYAPEAAPQAHSRAGAGTAGRTSTKEQHRG